MEEFDRQHSTAPFPTTNAGGQPPDKRTPMLDGHDAANRLRRLQGWWNEARIMQSEARREMALDEDFVDGLQWSEEDRAAMEERNQAPLVFNEILPAMLWVEGTERRARTEWKILPRADDDVNDALVKTEVMRYISDVNRARFERSRAFTMACRAGLGWLDVCVNGDPSEEVVKIRAESWRNVWYDQYSTDIVRDGRFVFRSKVIDTDVAQAMFPLRKNAIEQAAQRRDQTPYWAEDDFYDSALYNNSDNWRSRTTSIDDALGAGGGGREGVRLIEAWYREPRSISVMRGSSAHPLNGVAFSKDNPQHVWDVSRRQLDLVSVLRSMVRTSVFIDGGVLVDDGDSPYRHNLFPLVPIACYRRASDGAFYGMVRNARDPQSDLNKRRSKALFVLSTRRVIMDKGAINDEDMDEFEDEVSRPDGLIRKNKGYDLEVHSDNSLAEEHIMLAREDSEYIRSTSGVTGENLGQETNAQSGKAILARQNQGTVVTATLFDNALEADQIAGTISLSLIEQFMPEERVIRVVGNRGAPKFVPINQRQGDGSILNDMTARAADFIVSEQDYRESMRTALAEQMMDMIGKMNPDIALNLLDLAVELFDLPNKEEMVQRIRRLNGQIDPDDPNAATEADNADKRRQEEEARNAELARQDAETTIEERRAKTDKLRTEAQENKVNSLILALQAALSAIQIPQTAMVAQDLLEGTDLARPGSAPPPQQEQPPAQLGGPAPPQQAPPQPVDQFQQPLQQPQA